MFYVIGLGNPGQEYHHTPHNIGREMVDHLHDSSDTFGPFTQERGALVSWGTLGGQNITLIKALSFMNQSGQALRAYDEIKAEEVIVIYDDIDLPFGTIKIARNRGDGGHKGVQSIERALHSRHFLRLRVGVCPLDWFGRPCKPRGAQAVSHYLIHRRLPRRLTRQYPLLAQRLGPILHSLATSGYEKTISQHQPR